MNPSGLKIDDTPQGCRLRLRVRACARRNAVLGAHGEALKVAVSAPPERGRANRAVLDLLAAALGVPASRLSIVSGETSPDKTIAVEGLEAGEALRRLEDEAAG